MFNKLPRQNLTNEKLLEDARDIEYEQYKNSREGMIEKEMRGEDCVTTYSGYRNSKLH